MRYLFALFIFIILVSCSSEERKHTPVKCFSEDTLAIASFNIQVFGQSKMRKPAVMERITGIIRNFDIVAIQEIRSKKQDIMPRLVEKLGEGWDFVISERLGRTSSKEQYAFVYKTDKIIIDSTLQIEDPDDNLHREPFVCFARAGEFDFCLINIHTDPDEVKDEVNALDDVLIKMLVLEKDAILLGDLNASEPEFGEINLIPDISWAVPEKTPTNVRMNKTYDNIVFIQNNFKEFIAGGVYNYTRELGLTREDALDISDHFPVYVYAYTGGEDDD